MCICIAFSYVTVIAKENKDIVILFESDVQCAFDVYAKVSAIKSKENIQIVSADLCSADIEYMTDNNSPWKACAFTDFRANGEQGIRILALELNNEYDSITDADGEKDYLITSDWLAGYIGINKL